jgi:hypothetical protein
MAYDSARFLHSAAIALPREDFRRGERLVVLMGGAALGILAALGGALALGRIGMWPIAVGAPVFVLAVYFSVATLRDAIERRAFGCATAAGLVAFSLMAWPAAAMFFSIETLQFWIAPMAALGSMVLLASCWSGAQGAVYRLSGEAAALCMVAGYIGITQIMS